MLQSVRQMLGRQIKKIVLVERYSNSKKGNIPYARTEVLLETKFELAGWKEFILSNAAQRGKHIVLEFTEINTKKTCCVRWALGLGALFCRATDEQMTKYPFCHFGIQQARANFCFAFVPKIGSPSYLVIIDCLNLANEVSWVIFFNQEITENTVWGEYEHICAFSDTDRWFEAVTKTNVKLYDGWSNACVLAERKLFHGVGKYLTTEVFWTNLLIIVCRFLLTWRF